MARDKFLLTDMVTFGDLFARGRVYRALPYGGSYSWDRDNWDDLWDDLMALDESTAPHYMGSIVLQESEAGLVVIDGQQRLATLSILALAILSELRALIEQGIEAAANQERFDILFAQFIGAKDPASLRASSKLFLNENDNDFYQQFLVQFKRPFSERKLKHSQRLLWQAYQYFVERLEKQLARNKTGEALASFLNDRAAKRLLFIQVRVQDELSAYTVFETLNARRMELTTTDLLKNYLFSRLAPSSTDLDQGRSQWNRISEAAGAREFPVFLRHFIASQQPFVRTQRLFQTVRDTAKSREKVFELLDNLERTVQPYVALDEPYDTFWHDYPDAKELVRALALFRVSQYKPLLLACFRRGFKMDHVRRVLRICMVISFRFNVIGRRSAHPLEEVYNRVAVEVFEGRAVKPQQIEDQLKTVYVPDDEFINDFSTATFSTTQQRKIVRYILARIEAERSRHSVDFETVEATIEHILPENPGAGWDWSDDNRERFTGRLGNLTLLEFGPNRDAGSKPYAEKLPVYRRSGFAITNSIRAAEWTPEAVESRQRELAKEAAALWRL